MEHKQKIYPDLDIQFVTSSKWLRKMAQKSTLLKKESVIDMVTPVDTDLFKPNIDNSLRKEYGINEDKKVILFLAMSAVDERKGFSYLIDALKIIAHKEEASSYEVMVVGRSSEELFEGLDLKIHLLGLIKDKQKIVEAYNVADVFVIPSLEDNLPNTIMESLACGTPVVGFNTGGIPEMIDHTRNGYVAEFKNAEDLSKGILWVLNEEMLAQDELTNNAREKALKTYSFPVVASLYADYYKSLLKSS